MLFVQKDDNIHSHPDDHQEDDAPPEGEKRVKRHKASKSSKSAREETVIDEDEVILEDETPELIIKLQDVDKRVPTIFDYERMRATLDDALKRFLEVDLEEKMNRWVRKEFKTFNEEARLSIQHWKDSWHKRVYKQNQRRVRNNPEDYYSNQRITEVVRITTDQPHGLDFMEQIIMMRENDKPDSFSKADFKYLNKNDIEDLYYLCWNRKLEIESYQIKVNLTAPTLTFPSIEAHESYSIVARPSTGLIYLNNKDEKRVMYLTEIVKFCDATLEKVLKEGQGVKKADARKGQDSGIEASARASQPHGTQASEGTSQPTQPNEFKRTKRIENRFNHMK
ncbi:hypothetical protein Tco_0240849 [Tanacetum coccineum]